MNAPSGPAYFAQRCVNGDQGIANGPGLALPTSVTTTQPPNGPSSPHITHIEP